jgi:branched-chain amino acid aminotransferase
VQPEIAIHRTSSPQPHPADSSLGFGRVFTDHMFVIDWESERGWYEPRVVPRAPFSLDPAAGVLHYGQALFEGMKAFRGADGRVRMFRAPDHCARLNESAERLCMPTIPVELLMNGLRTLIRVDEAWVPSSPGTGLYIRPTMVATEPFLGVRAANRYMLFVILSPVASYYGTGMSPVKIWVEQHYVRAARGGLGAVKAGANYAASLLVARKAKERGFAQVLWLDAATHREIEEVGTMNVFFRIGDEVVTPALGGSILAGMTRDSVLTLLREWGIRAVERTITLDELVAANRDGTLREAFGSGTAALISPVGELNGDTLGRIVINDGRSGEMAGRLFDALTALHYARTPDTHGWLVDVA